MVIVGQRNRDRYIQFITGFNDCCIYLARGARNLQMLARIVQRRDYINRLVSPLDRLCIIN